ncbi:MAG: carbohydrate porin, partial [Emcibacteraceae bacterium]|nr:carbohydrate porin [Emcibacteraceae bacterium]
NKHAFSTLFNPSSTTAMSYSSSLSGNTTYETTLASSKQNVAEEIIGHKLNVKSTLMLNRINHYVNDDLTLSFDVGVMQEKGSVLGAVSTGALEIGSGANTGFVGGKMDWKITENSLLFARASYGVTDVMKSNTSILGNISMLKSFSYLLGVKSSGLMRADDQLSFTISQPLKLVGGNAAVSNATSRNYLTNSFTTNYTDINLGPSGTERNLELAYKVGNFFGSSVGVNLLHQFNPGHVKSIKSATSALLRIRSSF